MTDQAAWCGKTRLNSLPHFEEHMTETAGHTQAGIHDQNQKYDDMG